LAALGDWVVQNTIKPNETGWLGCVNQLSEPGAV